MLYLTWARQNAPENQQLITAAYSEIARELSAAVIPAGVAWQDFVSKHDRPALYDRDGSHPTIAGSYLAASIAFAVLFDHSIVGADVEVEGLTLAERTLLARAAAKVL